MQKIKKGDLVVIRAGKDNTFYSDLKKYKKIVNLHDATSLYYTQHDDDHCEKPAQIKEQSWVAKRLALFAE